MIPTLYRGSVKDVLGPVKDVRGAAVVFEYTDAYSVFDWGRMPDLLSRKGEALAILAADWFERLERPESWREFSRSPAAQALRKASRFGGQFIEQGERLQSAGLRTHYRGLVAGPLEGEIRGQPTSELKTPTRRMLVTQVSAVKPTVGTVLGRSIPDYYPTRQAPLPRLIPLEVVFRFSCPPGSSLLSRVEEDPQYLALRGFPEVKPSAGVEWEFPVLETFTKLEATDRPLTLTEALSISGVSSQTLQEALFNTAWVAAWLRATCAEQGLVLADGKLEWAVAENGECWLVDAVGPDELRILRNGIQLSKEFLRGYYRATPWYEQLSKGKALATPDWKRNVAPPPALPPAHRELASQLYLSLTNRLTGREWFAGAPSIEEIASRLGELT